LSVRAFYASDIHGSDRLWRKFINSAKFYNVENLIMGGDLAGKAVIPIVQRDGGFFVSQIAGDQRFEEADLPEVERRIRDLGQYPYRMTEDELDAASNDQAVIDSLFREAMAGTLHSWLGLARERLAGTGTQLYIMLGNDDEPSLKEVIDASSVAVDCEDRVADLGEGFQMMSLGYANPTPWHSPRELPEDQLQCRLEELAEQLNDPSRSVFNLHVPPINTTIDEAPVVDENLSAVVVGGNIQMGHAGSTAVRNLIEKYQPLIALHGHIHESRGTVKIGKTVCVNPGSEYGEGVLHGALFELDKKKGLKLYQLTSG
jgi:Icc-related predicted phosphoesterase